MKASYRWLRELVPSLTASPREVAASLTGVGIEVEAILEYGVASDHVVLARVEGVRPHPSKSGLRLVMVDRGGGAKQELVCGAPNVPEPGWLVVLAPLGVHLPAKNLTIAKRAIGGVESEGMLCSESELGLGDDHDGILVFPPGTAEPGTPLSKLAPNARDTVFEIGLTPNRPDGLGHVGLARQLAAIHRIPFAWPDTGLAKVKTSPTTTASLVSIVVEDAERCPHFGALAALDVTIAPSPLDVRFRLQALGVRSISNVVDVTNLVMLEYGHPLHAFDLDKVRGNKVGARRAKAGETVVTLDGVTRNLDPDDVVVFDGEGPVALAGIMGGASSEISATTKRVLFECAYWQPRGVRRSARRHGMHTDASHRFERGVDTDDIPRVLDRAAALSVALGGGAVTTGRVHVQGARVSAEPEPTVAPVIKLRARRIGELLGLQVPWADALAILERLGCTIAGKTESEADVRVPTHRPDLQREADLVEEVLQLTGIDNVVAELPAIRASRDVGGREALASRARGAATAIGLSEALTFGFTHAKTLEHLRAPAPAVTLKNPLGEHHGVMRTTLLPGLLDAVNNARRHGERDVREFTVGPVFLSGEKGGLPTEELRIAFVLTGERPTWLAKPSGMDAWDAKGYAVALTEGIAGVAPRVVPAPGAAAPAHLHPRGAAFLEIEGKRIGTFGPLHPDVVDALALDGDVMVCELSLEPFLAGARTPKYAAIPRFPAATRDIALVVSTSVSAGEVGDAVRDAAGALAEDVRIFDRFVGDPVPAGFASLAFHIVYRAADRTLTDAEVDTAHANVEKVTKERFGAVVRQ